MGDRAEKTRRHHADVAYLRRECQRLARAWFAESSLICTSEPRHEGMPWMAFATRKRASGCVVPVSGTTEVAALRSLGRTLRRKLAARRTTKGGG